MIERVKIRKQEDGWMKIEVEARNISHFRISFEGENQKEKGSEKFDEEVEDDRNEYI